jgi:hypothetical protein
MKQKFLIARLSLALLFAIVTVLQLFSFPGQFAHMRAMEGISLLQEIALTALFTILLLCAQFIIFALWRLVQLMEQGRLFTPSGILWLSRIVRALLTALAMSVALFLIIAPQADDPGILVLLTALILFLLACSSISSLLRDQFRSQISNK